MTNNPWQFSPEETGAALGLLAVIHGDGGHYVMEHGVLKALVDATEKVVAERAAREEAVIHYPHGKQKLDSTVPPPEVSVHILYHGLPLCVFSTNLPAAWPLGNLWVSLEQREFATCTVCIARVPKEWKLEPLT